VSERRPDPVLPDPTSAIAAPASTEPDEVRARTAHAAQLDANPSCPTCGREADGLLTLRQVARKLNVSERTVRREVAAGRFHCVRIGRSVRFTRNDVVRFVAAARE
jgi:excisionase family DNA binding protein